MKRTPIGAFIISPPLCPEDFTVENREVFRIIVS